MQEEANVLGEDKDMLEEMDSDTSSDSSSINIETRADKIDSGQENPDQDIDKNNTKTDATSGERSGVKYIEVWDSDGSSKMIRVSTLIWSMRKSNKKLCSDRTRRVQKTAQGDDTKDDVQQNRRFKPNEPSPVQVTIKFSYSKLIIYQFLIGLYSTIMLEMM